MADHLAHAHAGERHDQIRQDGAEEGARADHQRVDAAEEGRVELLVNGVEGVGRGLVVLRAHDAIHEVHRELDALIRAQQVSELLGGLIVFVFRRGQPGAGELDCVIDNRVCLVGISQRGVRIVRHVEPLLSCVGGQRGFGEGKGLRWSARSTLNVNARRVADR